MRLGDLVGPQVSLPEGVSDLDIKGLGADSREVAKGYLFAAFPGTQADGTQFIDDAIAKGAAAVLTSEKALESQNLSVPVIEAPDPRRSFALMAARFYGAQPEIAAAVTGTNGKTSVVSFLQQIWLGLGFNAASIGTVGMIANNERRVLGYTTPDPVSLHSILAELAKSGTTHLALEASSHGLKQRRLDGVKLKAAAFTNITRDHLDYHGDFEDYEAQKMRLFDELLPDDGAVVVNADALHADIVYEIAELRKLRLLTVGRNGKDLKLEASEPKRVGQQLQIRCDGQSYDVALPLVGAFQASNALVAAGLALACGGEADAVLPLLSQIKGAPGRLEHVGTAKNGAPVFIDYAHSPDALANALDSLRPYAKKRLLVVFGCGGDRDKGKRPLMGAIAGDRADLVFVTDDNPRTEDAAKIRMEILKSIPDAKEVGDRSQAIAAAIASAAKGDVVLVAGKGHETGQIVGDEVLPFSDHDAVASALDGQGING